MKCPICNIEMHAQTDKTLMCVKWGCKWQGVTLLPSEYEAVFSALSAAHAAGFAEAREMSANIAEMSSKAYEDPFPGLNIAKHIRALQPKEER